MSIDEVMKIAAVFGPDSLRTAIEQHVAEEVAREREELLDLVDSYAKDNADLKDAVRARAEKETT